jgi:hypothetical protein
MPRVIKNEPKPLGWWTQERRALLWQMYEDGIPYRSIAEHFECSVASVQRQIYNHKKGMWK